MALSESVVILTVVMVDIVRWWCWCEYGSFDVLERWMMGERREEGGEGSLMAGW
jgi:hypothetical protein